ncbi:MAG TPA: EamA family transporter [Opitutaceae bacterium]
MNRNLFGAIVLIASTSVCDTANHLGLKVCADRVGVEVSSVRSALQFVLRLLRMPLAWLSIGFSLLSLFLWLGALTMTDLSLAFSLDSLHHVWIAMVSAFVLKENLSWKRWLGTAIIILGIVLVALSGAES